MIHSETLSQFKPLYKTRWTGVAGREAPHFATHADAMKDGAGSALRAAKAGAFVRRRQLSHWEFLGRHASLHRAEADTEAPPVYTYRRETTAAQGLLA